MGKVLVYVLVPYTVGATNVADHAHQLLKPHEMPGDRSRGWYDYLCRLEPVFDDPITEGFIPDKQKRTLHHHICDVSRLPHESRPDALITPDGFWHSCEVNIRDFKMNRNGPEPAYQEANAVAQQSWPTRYSEIFAAHPHCWVVATWAHS